jgi:GINS complex subunit 4
MDPKTNFRLIIIQTELERFKFLVRSFLRARLSKVCRSILPQYLYCYQLFLSLTLLTSSAQIDAHPLHHLSSSIIPLLSPSELAYIRTHQALISSHYASSFLSAFPPTLQRLDDTAGGISMISTPDVDSAVFLRVIKDVHEEVRVPGTEVSMQWRKGDVWVVRWSVVKGYVLSGDVELI